MNNKFISIVITLMITVSFLLPSVVFAEGECAHVEAYIMNLETGQGVPDSQALLRCQDTFLADGEVVHQCTEEGASYGSCWENSGWRSVPSNGHVFFSPDGYDCFVGNPMLETSVPEGWTFQCSTDGSENDCSGGSNVDSNNLQVINGGAYVFKMFYSPPVAECSPPEFQYNQCVECNTSEAIFQDSCGVYTPEAPQPDNACNYLCLETPAPTPEQTPEQTTSPLCPVPSVVTNIGITCPYCP